MAESNRHPITVPELGDPDRKRALNVLAQRRYRQRRREKIKALEKKVQSSVNSSSSPATSTSSSSGQFSHHSNDVHNEEGGVFINSEQPTELPSQDSGLVNSISGIQSLDFDSFLIPGTFSDIDSAGLPTSNMGSLSAVSYSFDLALSPESTLTAAYAVPMSEELQSLEASQFTFPDDNLMPIPELACMQAGLNIAELLGCVESMWDLTCLRKFPRSSIPISHIPSNLEPTDAQSLIPHHPLIDIFPWPSVRTRVICVFAQPLHTRPASAREPDALMKLFYDMDDGAEGMRVTGSDWYDGNNWEIGQVVYKNWWWAFDRGVINNSNALRRKRGAKLLTLEAS